MKQLILPAFLAITGSCLLTTAFAQESKSPVNKSEEIIISTDGDKETKAIIKIDGEKITVNGQPLSEYKGDNIKITKRKTMIADGSHFLNFPKTLFAGGTNLSGAFLGVATEKNEKGARIVEVTKGSSAEKGGLLKNDIITKVDKEDIDNPEDLSEEIANHKPGDKVAIQYLRDGKKKTATIELGKRNNEFPFALVDSLGRGSFSMPQMRMMPRNFERNFRFFSTDRPKLGAEIEDTPDNTGATILNVEAGSPADKAGLKKGDIIRKIGDENIENASDVLDELYDDDATGNFQFEITREGKKMNIAIAVPKKLNKIKL